jgi:hypothetical protein
MPARLAAAVRSAAPIPCRPDAEALQQLALECLDPVPARRPNEADARKRFAELDERLSADRLARYWEAENRPAVAAELRRRAGSPAPSRSPVPPGPAPVETLPPGKDWSDVAREAVARGELAKALSAAWNSVFAEGPHTIELYLTVVQRMAGLSPPRAELAAALNRLDKAYGPEQIGEANLLRIAHLRVRHLGATEEDVYPLLQARQGEWARAVGVLMRAMFQARKAAGRAAGTPAPT